jgi:hemolysin III
MWHAKVTKYNSQENVNAITHGLGVLLVLIGAPILLYRNWIVGNNIEFLALLVFSFASLMVYTASTLYHATPDGKLKDKLHRLDHISIYLMIAGTHTPFVIKYMNNEIGTNFLICIWTLVFIGIIYKVFYFERYPKLSLTYYLVLGWTALFITPYYSVAIPMESLIFIFSGGIFYSIGVIFYAWRLVHYSHAVWHTFVLMGSITHYLALCYIFT